MMWKVGLTTTLTAILLAVAFTTLLALTYDRSEWRHWTDEDGDCQDTRQEVLLDEAAEVALEPDGCRVTVGRWVDPYSGHVIRDPSLLDIDHLVPLQNAWKSGGWAWTRERKEAYANWLVDPEHLVAVHRSLNRSKGSKAPHQWLPPVPPEAQKAYACDWLKIKDRWGLMLTVQEARFLLVEMGC